MLGLLMTSTSQSGIIFTSPIPAKSIIQIFFFLIHFDHHLYLSCEFLGDGPWKSDGAKGWNRQSLLNKQSGCSEYFQDFFGDFGMSRCYMFSGCPLSTIEDHPDSEISQGDLMVFPKQN